jgi:hypothetical protein
MTVVPATPPIAEQTEAAWRSNLKYNSYFYKEFLKKGIKNRLYRVGVGLNKGFFRKI